MLSCIQRVARMFLAQQVEEESTGSKPSGTVSGKWVEWLKNEHDGGKEKVSNPNPKTRKQRPEVTFSTALRNKAFYDKALQDYKKWLGKKDSDSPEAKKDSAPEPESNKKGFPKPSSEKLDRIIEEHRATFDRISNEMQKSIKKFKAEKTKKRHSTDRYPAEFKKAFEALSPQEQAIMAAGQELGKYFQEHIAKKNKSVAESGHDIGMGWRLAGDMSKSELVQNLIGVVESFGVKGSRLPSEEGEESKGYRKSGASDKDLVTYAKEAYEFTQAYFKHLGIKEVTLYRGVKGQGIDKAAKGDEVELETRSLSSFSLNAATAKAFGKCIEFKVPVEDIFLSSLSNPGFEHEAEMVVMGSPKKGRVI